MKLQELLKNVDVVKIIGEQDIDVLDVVMDSSKVTPDSLFICIDGLKADGHDFINQAYTYGAIAILTNREMISNMTQIVVKDTRKAMSVIAGNFYNNPQENLKIIAVTGTNGKTTTSHLIFNILRNNGVKCGLIGTLGNYFRHIHTESALTTPDPLELYKTFDEMVKEGIDTVVMEASAHALYYDKLYRLKFEVAIFTNLTHDHLDFFKNMKNYEEAKLKLFTENKCKYIVSNNDDVVGLKITRNYKNVISYGLENPADNFAIDITEKINKTEFTINVFDCVHHIKTSLVGKFNIYNILAGATACALLGIKGEKIFSELENFKGVNGRLEKIRNIDKNIYIDYAHTPDGLKCVLTSLKTLTKSKLICVFGCGGNRDKEKRAIMGEISGKYSDFTVITSDNPRFEDPMEIIYDIENGIVKTTKSYVIVQDRFEAIKYAVDLAKNDDIILIAGKGAEEYQDVLGVKTQYNDKDSVMEIVRS